MIWKHESRIRARNRPGNPKKAKGCADRASNYVDEVPLCRNRGKTVRKPIDCLLAAIAIRAGASLFHCDSDFNVLARQAPLRVAGF